MFHSLTSKTKVFQYRLNSILQHRFQSNIVCRSSINTIGVVGGGQMGMGITITAAINTSKNIIVMDNNIKLFDKSWNNINKWISQQVSKNKLSESDKDSILSRIKRVNNLNDLNKCDFIIEAVTENETVKKSIFVELDNIVSSDVILCSNTSSIPITKIGGWTNRNDKVCGMHFMNPVPVMKLVEIIPSLTTSNECINIVKQLSNDLNKITSLSKDEAGFIVNRILMPYINESILLLQEGISSKEDIDNSMKLGTNVPMGPLTLADFIGLDTCLFIQKTLHSNLGDKYKPATLLERYVEAGYLGRKTNQGFYNYNTKT